MEAKRRKWIFVSGIVLALLAGFGVFWQLYHPNNLREVLRKKCLTVALDNSSFGLSLSDSTYAGFNYEVARAFADSLGVELKVKRINGMDKQLHALRKHDCNLVTQQIPVTTCYKDVSYSKPFYISRLVLVQRTESKLITQKQLGGKIVTIADNAPYVMRLNHLSAEIADTIRIHTLPNLNDELLVRMVADDEIDYTVCVELQAKKWKQQYPNLDFSLPIGFSQQYGWAVNADSKALTKALNNFLKTFMQTAEYRQIYNIYFN